ncbi:MAG TPA: hypothetical protein VKB88_32810 [Bryobacteraceae bacterium]|nr:hypothetical protein [Bryobacteraceae bacterium]
MLKCIVEGHSTKQVAGMSGITFKIAVCHRYRLVDTLGVHDTVGLTNGCGNKRI